MSIWDDRDIASSGDYVRFDKVGDGVEGRIVSLERHTFVDDETGEKRVAPKLTLECTDGEERILTAGQVKLRLRLVELRPEVGDYLKITMTDLIKNGKKTTKLFDVQHRAGGSDRGARVVPARPASAETTRAAGSSKPPF